MRAYTAVARATFKMMDVHVRASMFALIITKSYSLTDLLQTALLVMPVNGIAGDRYRQRWH